VKSLSKQAVLDWAAFVAQAEQLWDEVMAKHASFAEAIAGFNALISEGTAVGMVEGWATDVELYTADRSESWLESERGQAYEAWHAALSELAGQIVEVDEPDEPDTPEWLTADLPFEPEL
jgi:hypothetical protein